MVFSLVPPHGSHIHDAIPMAPPLEPMGCPLPRASISRNPNDLVSEARAPIGP